MHDPSVSQWDLRTIPLWSKWTKDLTLYCLNKIKEIMILVLQKGYKTDYLVNRHNMMGTVSKLYVSNNTWIYVYIKKPLQNFNSNSNSNSGSFNSNSISGKSLEYQLQLQEFQLQLQLQLRPISRISTPTPTPEVSTPIPTPTPELELELNPTPTPTPELTPTLTSHYPGQC